MNVPALMAISLLAWCGGACLGFLCVIWVIG
jgi:hypothetical protein